MKGKTGKPSALRGGGLARKGTGMALKGGGMARKGVGMALAGGGNPMMERKPMPGMRKPMPGMGGMPDRGMEPAQPGMGAPPAQRPGMMTRPGKMMGPVGRRSAPMARKNGGKVKGK